jgi:prepilin-type N-terminal cleavage/methylation domain-containing protein
MKKGFTLTEVLIALSIIGVIAAMTIPNLLVSTGNKKLKTQLQKFMADMNQAIKLYEMDYGTILQADGNATANAFARVLLTKAKGVTTRPIYQQNSGTSWAANYPFLRLNDNSEVIFNGRYAIVLDIDGNANGSNRWGSDCMHFYLYQVGGAWMLLPLFYSPIGSSYTAGFTSHATYHYSRYSGHKCTGLSGAGCVQEILDTY